MLLPLCTALMATSLKIPVENLDGRPGGPEASPPFITLRLSLPGAIGIVALCILYALWPGSPSLRGKSLVPPPDDFQHLAEHCSHIPAISPSEFASRQTALARVLHALNASAYIAEPGASAEFYANLSSAQWSLSERPLLLVITPEVLSSSGGVPEVQGKVSILTPKFEATRAKLLHVPSGSQIEYAEWPEEADPYKVAVYHLLPSLGEGDGIIFVDGSTRTFIADGLRAAAPQTLVLPAPIEVQQLRERKSEAELDILKCVNEVTALAIREVRKKLSIGIRESEAGSLMRKALSSAGLVNVFALVLFGENAALPHGSGTDRVLSKADFVLIDCGGSLHGYNSDVTRTFAVEGSVIPPEHLSIWYLIHTAQRAALSAAYDGAVTKTVDEAARAVISEAGRGRYFTHRLGHGIGLEVHESPYLRGGSEDVIRTGHTFSDEPGVYIEGKVGVRLEDSFYINQDGTPMFLTEGVGGQARSPWDI